VLIQFTPG